MTEEQPQQDAELLALGGQLWRPIQRPTMAYIIWFDRQVIEAGLDSLRQEEGESNEKFAARIWRQLVLTDKVFTFLGGMLLPAELPDSDWTQALADRQAAFFARLSEPEEQRALRHRLIGLVLYFFVCGLGSWDFTGIASPGGRRLAAAARSGSASSKTSAAGAKSSGN